MGRYVFTDIERELVQMALAERQRAVADADRVLNRRLEVLRKSVECDDGIQLLINAEGTECTWEDPEPPVPLKKKKK